MNKLDKINRLLQKIKAKEGDSFTYNEETILAEYKHNDDNKSTTTIKILSVLGGILATLAFVGFLFLTRIFRSEVSMLVLGIVFVIAAIWVNKIYDKLIIDTASIALYIVGFLMIIFGIAEITDSKNFTVLVGLVIALVSLFSTQSYMLLFISVLALSGSLLSFIWLNEKPNAIHLYIVFQTLLLTIIFLNEAKIITFNKKFSRLYKPLRIGIMISFLVGLIATSKRGMIELSDNFFWISVIAISIGILYLIPKILGKLAIVETNSKIMIYVLILLLLGFSSGSPAILGGILIVLLSFYVNFRIGLVIGVASLIYFVSQYYYDLSFTLLTKSILLFGSGMLFIILYLFINKKLVTDDEV
ncbi:MAG: DUF4401 domain-containing protein [Flavobacteriaceae bacterium]